MKEIDYPEGATPLNPDEINGLLLTHITEKSELDRWEQENIIEALAWLEKQKTKDILNELFMKQLHKRMFGNVWEWAGSLRKAEKNLGVHWYLIPTELQKLCDNVEYWIENKTFSEDEIAVRFHHLLVSIHLFPNGNGRHARIMADTLLELYLQKSRFTWGSNANLTEPGEVRDRYIQSLREADNHKGYKHLLDFARS